MLITDYKPLRAIFNPAKHLPAMTAARLQRYALFLAGHSFNIVYWCTDDHANADGLSRLPLPATKGQQQMDLGVDAVHVA